MVLVEVEVSDEDEEVHANSQDSDQKAVESDDAEQKQIQEVEIQKSDDNVELVINDNLDFANVEKSMIEDNDSIMVGFLEVGFKACLCVVSLYHLDYVISTNKILSVL